MLASFPPPGLATPSERPSRMSRWPSPFANTALSRGQTASPNSPSASAKQRQRKCCGLPLWAFILLIIALVLLIAAAVVIPVTLIVIPRQHQHGSSNDNALAQCQKQLTCANGGTNVFMSNSCRCVCVNGYTGSQCTIAADDGCTTADLSSSNADYRNATLGSSIPRLFKGAESNFSIPLNSSALLSLFSTTNLSCTSENALVTFNGQSKRLARSVPLLDIEAALVEPFTVLPTPTPTPRPHLSKEKRGNSYAYSYASSTLLAPSSSSAPHTMTSNGIIMAAPTGTATAANSAATPSALVVDDAMLDFARISVLFILQQTMQLDTAVSAQAGIQSLFSKGEKGAQTVKVGGGITVDFSAMQVMLSNGTAVGRGT